MKTTKPITWQFYRPDTFPCFVCNEARAEVMVTITDKAVINVCCCRECAELPADDILGRA